jgi:hypothetical protein
MTVENTNAAINDDKLIVDICAIVAAGGTLTAYCGEHDLVYKIVNRWIADDEKRQERYKLALDIREQHAKDLIIAELIAYLKADVTSCFDSDGNMKRMPDMGANERRLIAGVKFREIFEKQDNLVDDGAGGMKKVKENVHVGNIIEVRFWDKPRSIETFMKHLSMLVERNVVDVGQTLADLIAGKPANKV